MHRLGFVFASMILMTACGGAGNADTTAPPTTDGGDSGVSAGLNLAESSEGQHLVDGEGFSLYLLVPDAQGESTCYEACATTWPPLTGELTAGDGVDGSKIGSVTRTDGSTQVTYNGWPLYYFANDAAAGETNGQGINDVWYLVTADGNTIDED